MDLSSSAFCFVQACQDILEVCWKLIETARLCLRADDRYLQSTIKYLNEQLPPSCIWYLHNTMIYQNVKWLILEMYIYIPWAVIHLRKKKERRQREVKSLLWYHFLFWFSFLQNLFYVFWQIFVIFLTKMYKRKKNSCIDLRNIIIYY